MDDSSLSGAQRAAVFLMSLGEDEAAEILRHMGSDEVQKVGKAMTSMTRVSRLQQSTILDHFSDTVVEQTSIGIGTDDYVRRLLTNALGATRARSLLDRILQRTGSAGLEALEWMETDAIYEMIVNEHPQIISIVIAHLDSERAANILGRFDETPRNDVLLRIATLDDIQDSAIVELEAVMSRQSEPGATAGASPVGGVKCAADILNSLESDAEEKVIEFIRDSNAEVCERIEDLMFSFEMLLQIDDRGMQTLLREINTETLTVALKGADPDIQDKIFNNMSKRAAELLRDDLNVRGPVRLSEVEESQKEILGVAKRLSDEGTIMLGGKGEEFV